ncbi:MAG: cation:proton antiporter [Longimicrobiales bacterium]|nr:cation:proton antiporter [Longimicrobiales bacterium]
MHLLYILLILLLVTRIFGELAVRLKQPALVGELTSGILLGIVIRQWPSAIPFLAELGENEIFQALTDLGVFFLMLLAGLEMRPKDIVEASARSIVIAVSGLLLPLTAGFALAWWFLPDSSVKIAQAAFVGTALAITAVPVAVRVLMDLGQLDTRAGRIIVSAAVFDDVLSLVILAVLVALINTGELPDTAGMLQLFLGVVVFFVVTVTVGVYLLPRLAPLIDRLRSDEFDFTLLLIVGFAFAVLAERLGLHFILGAFMAGLFFMRRTVDEGTYSSVRERVSGVTSGFLGPLFFASIGLHLQVDAVGTAPLFLGLLIAAAFATKLLGAGVPAYLSGMPGRASLAVGMAMSSRGAVELIIADVALEAGLFERPEPTPGIVDALFSSVVIVAIVTTLLVPICLRFIVPEERQAVPPEVEEEVEEELEEGMS